MADSSASWWRHPAPATSLETVSAAAERVTGSRLPFRALMLFTFILLLAPQQRFPFLAPLRIALLSAVLAMLAHVCIRISRGQTVVRLNTPTVLALCLALWAVLMVPFSLWPGGSIEYLLDVYFKTLVVFVLLANVVDSLDKLKRIAWGLALMAIPLALTTVKNFLAGNTLRGSDRIVGYSSSLASNPNDMALMLNLILPFCVALFLAADKPRTRLMLAGIIGLLAVAVILTSSRAGFLTLGLISLIYMWHLRKRRERVWIPVVLVVALAALPLLPASYFERLTTIVNIEEDESNSAQTRLGDMKAAASLALHSPLIGAGIGQNQLAMNEARGETWTEVHNVYLQIAVELGALGLILYLALYFSCLSIVNDVLRRTRGVSAQKTIFYLAEGIRVSLIAFALAAMFHPVAYHFYFYYIAGLALALRNVCGEQGANASPAANARKGSREER